MSNIIELNMIPKRKKTKDQHKNDVDPSSMNNATNTTRVDTREILLNDTLKKSNIRVTRRTKMKELEKVQRLSSRSL